MSHDTCSGGSMRPRLTPRTFEVLSFGCCAFVVAVGERVCCCLTDGAQIVAQILAHTPAWRADRGGARAASARAGADQAQLAVSRGAQDRASPNFYGAGQSRARDWCFLRSPRSRSPRSLSAVWGRIFPEGAPLFRPQVQRRVPRQDGGAAAAAGDASCEGYGRGMKSFRVHTTFVVQFFPAQTLC
jgi:hypothetical protein